MRTDLGYVDNFRVCRRTKGERHVTKLSLVVLPRNRGYMLWFALTSSLLTRNSCEFSRCVFEEILGVAQLGLQFGHLYSKVTV